MKRVLVILAPGFEEIEAVTVIDILRRANIDTTVTGLDDQWVTGSHQIQIKCDSTLARIDPQEFTHLFLPGGQPGTSNLKKDKRVLDLITGFYAGARVISAICAAPTVLYQAGILDGKSVTSYPSERETFVNSTYVEDKVVRDQNIITSRGIGTVVDFALALVADIHGDETRTRIAEKILWPV